MLKPTDLFCKETREDWLQGTKLSGTPDLGATDLAGPNERKYPQDRQDPFLYYFHKLYAANDNSLVGTEGTNYRFTALSLTITRHIISRSGFHISISVKI